MDEKELIGKTLAICKVWVRKYDATPVLHGTVQEKDGILTLDVGRQSPPIPIQRPWLDNIIATPDYFRSTVSNADFYVTVGEPPHSPDENGALGSWVRRRKKAEKVRRIGWILAGGAIGGAYALWQMIFADAQIGNLPLGILLGVWFSAMLVGKSKRDMAITVLLWLGVMALMHFYVQLLQYLWPSSQGNKPGGYDYGLESFVLTMLTAVPVGFAMAKLPIRRKISAT